MNKKLSEWAKEQNIPYKRAWQMIEAGTLPVKVEKSDTGRFFVVDAEASKKNKEILLGIPLMASQIQTLGSKKVALASGRRNAAATNERTDPYFHIESGVEPFEEMNNSISVREAIRLCQKTYWNFSIFRNVIDVMTEFSSNPIFFRGGNKKANTFFQELFKKINLLDLQDKFFREYYRSGNVFIYRFDSLLDESSIRKLSKAYSTAIASTVSLPAKYVILNPCDIIVAGNISFTAAKFFKQLNPYEVERLRKPKTEEEKSFYDSLPEETKTLLSKQGGGSLIINVPLEEENTYSIFYKKQDYEPMAVPMGYPVLKDINWKAEMKAIDMAISRTVQQAVLLINLGYESKNGDYMFDPRIAQATQELFSNESVGKVLVTDFATKVQFVIPDIGELLDPKKYEIVNEDIRVGLNHILTGKNEKFANQYIQVNLFIQRLQQSREVFLNGFLLPEIKRIAKEMNFKSYPEPYFEDLDLKDEIEWTRIITRLAEIGLLTPAETFEGIETGRIPTKDESLESQEEFKVHKDNGLYQPIAGGPADQMKVLKETNKNSLKVQENQQSFEEKQSAKQRKHEADNPPPAPPPAIHIGAPMKKENGRPSGSTKKQTVKRKTKPAGASFSLKEVKDKLWLANDIIEEVKTSLKDRLNLKQLNEEQLSLARELGESIIMNEESKDWKTSIAKYIENPDFKNEERLNLVEEVAAEHQLSNLLAAILLESGDA